MNSCFNDEKPNDLGLFVTTIAEPVDSFKNLLNELDSSASKEPFIPCSEMITVKRPPQYQIVNGISFRYFTQQDEALLYAEEKWKIYWDGIPEDLRDIVCCYEAMGRRLSDPKDRDVIVAAEKVLPIFPPLEEDIILFRGGKEKDFNGDRPFLASSFQRTVAESFAEKYNGSIYTICAHKGARIIPICGQGCLGYMQESEVLIETKRIIRSGNMCEYY